MWRKWTLVLLAVIPLAAGCAGSDSNSVDDYQDSVVTTRNRVDSALGNITAAQSRQDFLKRMDEAAVVINRAAEDFSEEDVPDEFEDESNSLVAALRGLSEDLAGTAAQIRQPGFENLFNSSGINFESWTETNRILRSLGKQGVDVRPLDRH